MDYYQQIQTAESLDRLFEIWKNKKPNAEINHSANYFIADGIVNSDVWNQKDKKRILYVLKEAYGDDDWSLASWLNETAGRHSKDQTWKYVAQWVYGIQNTSCVGMQRYKNLSEEERNEIARIVGMGALKYFILKVDARKNMLFNPAESIDFNGNTGPFIQYTYARIRSIMRKAGDSAAINNEQLVNANCKLNEKEVQLIQKMNEFGAAVEQAGKDYSPSGIANYCYELTKEFNQFYHDYSILNADTEEEKQLRLAIAANVAKVIKNGMQLLGIEVPERM